MIFLILVFLEMLHGKIFYPEGKLLDFTGSPKYKPFSGKKTKSKIKTKNQKTKNPLR